MESIIISPKAIDPMFRHSLGHDWPRAAEGRRWICAARWMPRTVRWRANKQINKVRSICEGQYICICFNQHAYTHRYNSNRYHAYLRKQQKLIGGYCKRRGRFFVVSQVFNFDLPRLFAGTQVRKGIATPTNSLIQNTQNKTIKL